MDANLETAHKLATFCEYAYQDAAYIHDACLSFGYVTTCFQTETDFCFVAEGIHDNIIVFRGIDDIEDLKTVVHIGFHKKHDGIHSGFLKSWWDLEAKLNQFIKTISFDKPLIICGHSLGGALAQISAAYYADFLNHIEVYAFGSPRVGTHPWAKHIKKVTEYADLKIFNFINLSDFATSLPWKIFGWKTVGNIIHIGKREGFDWIWNTRAMTHKISRYRRTLLLMLNDRI